jgi:hypothetical protein
LSTPTPLNVATPFSAPKELGPTVRAGEGAVTSSSIVVLAGTTFPPASSIATATAGLKAAAAWALAGGFVVKTSWTGGPTVIAKGALTAAVRAGTDVAMSV